MEDIIKLFLGLGVISVLGIGFLITIWFLLSREAKEKLRTVLGDFLQSPLGRRISFFLFIAGGLMISLASAAAFIAITGLLFTEEEIQELDLLAVYFIKIFRPEALTPLFEAITFLGNSQVVIGVVALSVIIGLIRRYWSLAILFILSVAGSQLFVFLAKQIIARPRPSIGYQVIETSGYSFPSGHAAIAIALYGLLWYVIFRALPNWSFRIIWTIILAFLIGGIAISRVYLGVHYPSDIAAGLAFGVAWTAFLIIAHEIWGNFKRRREVFS
ncbi:MAG: phosphatase PAP2 family protein [Candidatus Paceibacterales bacterium]